MADPPDMATNRPAPSRWSERVPIAAIASVGLLVSAYLAACQLGVLAGPWDPLFGTASSERVIHSALSRALPVPDAALGAAAYALEIVLDLAGGRERWRTHPWVVLAFGAVALGLALVGVALVAVQAFVVRAGCTLCLCSAAASISAAIAVAAGGEVQAALHAVAAAREERTAS